MAKKPTTDKTPAPAPAPSQPWGTKPSDGGNTNTTTNTAPDATADSARKPSGGNGGGTGDAPNAESTGNDAPLGNAEQLAAASDSSPRPITSTEQVPELNTSDVPGMDEDDDVDVDATHDQVERLAENDVSAIAPRTEVPSFVRDQITPSGVDIPLEMDRTPKPSLERSAYPSLGERLYQMVAGASPEIQEQFEERMLAAGEAVIEQLRDETTANAFTAAMVDGTRHYGPRVRSEAAQKAAVAVSSNAERNRRARRAAERVARQAQTGVTGKK